jgi:hypothetical protein
VKTMNPNGLTLDPHTYNDARTITFNNIIPNISNPISPAFKEGFENLTFPPAGWSRINPDNSTTWQRTTNAGGFAASSASMFVNNFNYSKKGQRDYIISPYFNLQGVIAPANLEFDLAYARYDSQLFDSLIVSVSTDCGGNWQTLYAKGNFELSTIGQVNFQASAFVPTIDQWRRESINLNAYIGQPNIRIRFENVTGNGNQLYIDNVWVFDGNVGIEEHSFNEHFKMYPNPTSNILNIETPKGATEICIYNLYGNKVLAKLVQNQELNQIEASSLVAGIYIVEVKTNAGNFRRKFVKKD